MAGIVVEEEDDEGFGDFKFVSTTTATATASPNPTAAASNRAADDLWSDFVSFNGSPHIETNPKPPAVGNSVEPFGLFADRSAKTSPAGAVPEKPKWVKPSGAIPLSLFGEEEEEEEGSGVVDSSSFNGSAGLFNHSNGDPGKNAPNLSSAVGLNDLIYNLYNKNQHIGLAAGESGVNIISNGGKLKELGMGIELKAELDPKPSNGFGFKTSNGEEQDDEDEWEFRAADAKARLKAENSKGHQSEGENASGLNFNFFPSWNGFSSDLNGFTSKSNVLESGTNGFKMTDVARQEDPDDDFGWDFKGAEMENNSKEGILKVEGSTSNLFEDAQPNFEFGNVVQEPTGVNVANDKNSQIFGLDFAFDMNPKPGSEMSSLSDSILTSNGKDAENGFNTKPAFGSFGFDEDVWDFKESASEIGLPLSQDEPVAVGNGIQATSVGSNDAVLQTELQFEEDPKVVNGFSSSPANGNVESIDNFWEFKGAFPDSNLKQERNEESQGNGKEAYPVSTFGNGKLENNDPLIYPDLPTSKSPKDTSNLRRQSSNISIDDLIASLYSQAAPIASVPVVQVSGEIGFGTSTKTTLEEEPENEIDDSDDSWDFKAAETEKRDASETSRDFMQQLSDTGLDSNQSGQQSQLMNSVDVFDDSSWEFKDGSSGLGYADQCSAPGLGEPQQKSPANVENDLLEFYSKLKDELRIIALFHLRRMKEPQGLAGFPCEDAKLETQSKEIQVLYNGLNPESSIAEGPLVNLSMRVGHLKGFLPVLGEKFQALEAEYQLSRKLLLAEEDPGSLIELLKHVSSMLRILRLGSVEERACYVTTWSKLISLCSQELKHGALLWKQALEKDIQGQLLSKSEGKKYILALGEVYRAVGVLGASTKLYKPWILTSPADFRAVSDMLNECSLVWSSSGLEEALRGMSDPIEFLCEGSVPALLESVENIHGLDDYALQTRNFAQEERLCRLSLLSTGSIRDMTVIEWNGEKYFLKLANLWANLVSCNPPDFPRIELS